VLLAVRAASIIWVENLALTHLMTCLRQARQSELEICLLDEYVIRLPGRVGEKTDPCRGKRLYGCRDDPNGVERERASHSETAKARLGLCALRHSTGFADKCRSLRRGDRSRKFTSIPIDIRRARGHVRKRITFIEKHEFEFQGHYATSPTSPAAFLALDA
jgi:hypothetical protein